MKGKYAIGIFFVLCLILGFLFYSLYREIGVAKIVFLDVGQGSATYVKTPEGYEILIDTGSSRAVLRELSQHRNFWDRDIDVVIATHADGDHIGALPDIFKRFNVSIFIDNGQSREGNGPYDVSQKLITENDYLYLVPDPGEKLFVGSDARFDFYFPYSDYVDGLELNKSSLVFKLELVGTNILFTGDTPKSIERYLVNEYGAQLASDILVVGHHGSQTSSSDVFINTINPEIAIISAGRDNPYGHPHDEVITTLKNYDTTIYGTYEYGTIKFEL